jgi:hypothetical protein
LLKVRCLLRGGRIALNGEELVMPMVDGKKYPYTEKGKAAAKKAKSKSKSKAKPKAKSKPMGY